MKLRCKQGDWAIIVKSLAGNEGKVVRCVQSVSELDRIRLSGALPYYPGPGWIIDRAVSTARVWTSGRREMEKPLNIIADCCLCPLPPSHDEDSTVDEIEKESVL